MPCLKPIQAWQTEKKEVVFWRRKDAIRELKIACGSCEGCLLDRSRQWATRCMHEAHGWQNNCFITLTYDDEHLPEDGSLVHEHFQAFIKALRKKYASKRKNDGGGIESVVYPSWHRRAGESHFPIRYYMAGEYGSQFGRPHYHACLFNHDFEDRELYSRTKSGSLLYRSAELESLWDRGFSSVGDVSFESAAYIARYCMKKAKEDKTHLIDKKTGVLRKDEYNRMSLRPYGIGAKFLHDYKGDIFPHDYVVVNGHKNKPPRYYFKQLEKVDPDLFERVGLEREKFQLEEQWDQSDERLGARLKLLQAKLKKLERNF